MSMSLLQSAANAGRSARAAAKFPEDEQDQEVMQQSAAGIAGLPKASFSATPDKPTTALDYAADYGLSALGAVGNFLDVPASMVRDVTTWVPGGIEAQNPFDQILSPFSSDNRVSGEEMLQSVGAVGKDTWPGFLGGLALEIGLDPLTYLTLGSLAVGKGAIAAGKAGLGKAAVRKVAQRKADDIARSLGKKSPRIGNQLARQTTTVREVLDDYIDTELATKLRNEATSSISKKYDILEEQARANIERSYANREIAQRAAAEGVDPATLKPKTLTELEEAKFISEQNINDAINPIKAARDSEIKAAWDKAFIAAKEQSQGKAYKKYYDAGGKDEWLDERVGGIAKFSIPFVSKRLGDKAPLLRQRVFGTTDKSLEQLMKSKWFKGGQFADEVADAASPIVRGGDDTPPGAGPAGLDPTETPPSGTPSGVTPEASPAGQVPPVAPTADTMTSDGIRQGFASRSRSHQLMDQQFEALKNDKIIDQSQADLLRVGLMDSSGIPFRRVRVRSVDEIIGDASADIGSKATIAGRNFTENGKQIVEMSKKAFKNPAKKNSFAAQTLLHELGHAFIVTSGRLQDAAGTNARDVFQKFLDDGSLVKYFTDNYSPTRAGHYLQNPDEAFAQIFADHVLKNKIPNRQYGGIIGTAKKWVVQKLEKIRSYTDVDQTIKDQAEAMADLVGGYVTPEDYIKRLQDIEKADAVRKAAAGAAEAASKVAGAAAPTARVGKEAAEQTPATAVDTAVASQVADAAEELASPQAAQAVEATAEVVAPQADAAAELVDDGAVAAVDQAPVADVPNAASVPSGSVAQESPELQRIRELEKESDSIDVDLRNFRNAADMNLGVGYDAQVQQAASRKWELMSEIDELSKQGAINFAKQAVPSGLTKKATKDMAAGLFSSMPPEFQRAFEKPGSFANAVVKDMFGSPAKPATKKASKESAGVISDLGAEDAAAMARQQAPASLPSQTLEELVSSPPAAGKQKGSKARASVANRVASSMNAPNPALAEKNAEGLYSQLTAKEMRLFTGAKDFAASVGEAAAAMRQAAELPAGIRFADEFARAIAEEVSGRGFAMRPDGPLRVYSETLSDADKVLVAKTLAKAGVVPAYIGRKRKPLSSSELFKAAEQQLRKAYEDNSIAKRPLPFNQTDAYKNATQIAEKAKAGSSNVKYDIAEDVSTAGARSAKETEEAAREWATKGTDSMYFQRWFQGSKVVDESGEPLVVYHGTNTDLSAFDTERPANSLRYGSGAYFTDDPSKASYYSSRFSPDGANVGAYFINLKNPYRDVPGARIPESLAQAVLDSLPQSWLGDNGRQIVTQWNEHLASIYDEVGFLSHLFDNARTTIDPSVIRRSLSDAGYDGVIGIRKGNDTEYVAFDPTQIKSATGNRGTFDPTNADIRYDIADDFSDEAAEAWRKSRKTQATRDAAAKRDKAQELTRQFRKDNKIEYEGRTYEGQDAINKIWEIDETAYPAMDLARQLDETGGFTHEGIRYEGARATEKIWEVARKRKPHALFDKVPDLPTPFEMYAALSKGKRDKVLGVPGSKFSIDLGASIASRLDIDAYRYYGVFAPTLHQKGKSNHAAAVKLSPAKDGLVTFITEPKKAVEVAQGGSKGPFAKIEGKVAGFNSKKNYGDIGKAIEDGKISGLNAEAIYDEAVKAIESKEWTQISMNPDRGSPFFYEGSKAEKADPNIGRPIKAVKGDVLQVGALVLAKKADVVFASAKDFPVKKGSVNEATDVFFDIADDAADVEWQAADGLKYFSEEAIQKAQAETSGKSRQKLISMRIDDFLAMAENLDAPVPSKVNAVSKLLSQDEKFSSIPYLGFTRTKDGIAKVVGHEGRHRAMALKEAGVDSIPVLLESRGNDAIRWNSQAAGEFDRISGKWPAVLRGESGGEIRFPVKDPTSNAMFDISDDVSAAGARSADEAKEAAQEWVTKGTDSKYFQRWSNGLPVVRSGAYEYNGGGAVFEAYHGSTHAGIDTFEQVGNKEGFLGQGPYFSTNADDVSANYAGVGPDLQGRIESEAEKVAEAYYDDSYYQGEVLQDYIDDMGLDVEFDEDLLDELDSEFGQEAIQHRATKNLKGDTDGLMMKTYVKLENPADTTGRSARSSNEFTYEYQLDADGEIVGESGTLLNWLESADRVLDDFGVSGKEEYIEELRSLGENATMADAFDLAQKHFGSVFDYDGEYISPGGVFREIAQDAGYDGIIMDADKYFGSGRRGPFGARVPGMQGVDDSTYHIVPFNAESVKSATGNTGAFSPTDPRINYDLADKASAARNLTGRAASRIAGTAAVAKDYLLDPQLRQDLAPMIGYGLDEMAGLATGNPASRAISGLFSPQMMGAVSPEAQRMAPERYRQIDQARAGMRDRLFPVIKELLESEMFNERAMVQRGIPRDQINNTIRKNYQAITEYLEDAKVLLDDAPRGAGKDAASLDADLPKELQDYQPLIQAVKQTVIEQQGGAEALLKNAPLSESKVPAAKSVELPEELEYLRPQLNAIREELRQVREMELGAGLKSAKLNDLFIDYLPRQRYKFPGDKTLTGKLGKFLEPSTVNQIEREDFLKDIPGGTALINEISIDPVISGWKHSNPDKTIPPDMMGQFREHLIKNYGGNREAGDRLFMLDDDNMQLDNFIQWVTGLDPRHAELQIPAFKVDPIASVLARMEAGAIAAGGAELTTDWLSSAARVTTDLPDGVNMTDLVSRFSSDGFDRERMLDVLVGKMGSTYQKEQARMQKLADERMRAKITTMLSDGTKKGEVAKEGERVMYQGQEHRIAGMSKNMQEAVLIRNGADGTDVYVNAKPRDISAPSVGRNVVMRNFKIDKGTADGIVRYMNGFTEPDAAAMIREGLTSITNLYRSGLTIVWPAFHVRNVISGMYQNSLGGAFSVRSMREADSIFRGQDIDDAVNFPAVRRAIQNRADRSLQDEVWEFATYDPEDKTKTTIKAFIGDSEVTITDAKRTFGGGAEVTYIDAAGKEGTTSLRQLEAGKVTPTKEQANEELRRMLFVEKLFDVNQGMTGEFLAGEMESLRGQVIGGKKRSLREIFLKAPPAPPGTSKLQQANPLRGAGVFGQQDDVFLPYRWGRQVGQYAEGLVRGAPFIELLRKGYAPEEAARVVRELQFDYSRTTPADRYARVAFPFWSYTKNIVPLTVRQLMEKPGGLLGQTIRASSNAKTDEPLPGYLTSTAAIPFGSRGGASEGQSSYITGLGLGFEDPLQLSGFVSGNFADTGRNVISRMNPLIKGPLEAAFGESSYYDGPGGGRALTDLDPTYGRIMSNLSDLVTGENTIRPKPILNSPMAEQLLSNLPTSRIGTTLRTITDKRKLSNPAKLLLNLGTGIRVTDLSEAAWDADVQNTVMNMMKDLGARDFTRTYFPQYVKDRMTDEEKQMSQDIQGLLDWLATRAKNRADARKAEAEAAKEEPATAAPMNRRAWPFGIAQ